MTPDDQYETAAIRDRLRRLEKLANDFNWRLKNLEFFVWISVGVLAGTIFWRLA